MIEYKLRTSTRSRSVRLLVRRESGLEIVVPRGFDRTRIPAILAGKEQWIKRSFEKVNWSGAPVKLPDSIHLRSVDQQFTVVVDGRSQRRRRFVETGNVVTLHADPSDTKIQLLLLNRWLRQKSRGVLLPWLDRIGSEHGFNFNKATVRSQRTRWGSCSFKKNISLNQALVLLRPELVEYLMIHELCHTQEMSHSKKFWSLVELHCPDFRMLDKELKRARNVVERWAC